MMRLGRSHLPRPQIPVIPLANLALLVLTCVMVAAMYSASRGPGLRFASVERDGGFNEADAVRVEVLSEQDVVVDGANVPFAGLAGAVSKRLEGRPDAGVVLTVSPEATYEAMVAAYGAIAGLPGPPRIAFPARVRGTQG
jgi:biopolymer transport protein ExbD